MSRKKKKISSMIGLLLMLIISSAVGVTLSFLSYSPTPQANIFTFSDVSIRIVEEQWDALDEISYAKILYPGRTISKDPKIENTGINELYAYMEVSVPKAEVCLIDQNESIQKQTVELFTYTVTGEHWVELESYSAQTDEQSTRLYAYLVPLQQGEQTTALFDSITFANVLEGDLPMGTQLEVKVNAFAIQTGSLNEQGNTPQEKLQDAFGKYLAQKAEDDN
ncbi:MAG: hypothetical protein ACI4M3_00865 [Acutalibacteraceae bacterium]